MLYYTLTAVKDDAGNITIQVEKSATIEEQEKGNGKNISDVLKVVDEAIERVSTQRAELGAVLQSSVYNAYSALIVNFILSQLFIIMVHNKNESLSDRDIADSIYFFSKFTDHSKNKIIVMGYPAKESPALSLVNLVSMVMY